MFFAIYDDEDRAYQPTYVGTRDEVETLYALSPVILAAISRAARRPGEAVRVVVERDIDGSDDVVEYPVRVVAHENPAEVVR